MNEEEELPDEHGLRQLDHDDRQVGTEEETSPADGGAEGAFLPQLGDREVEESAGVEAGLVFFRDTADSGLGFISSDPMAEIEHRVVDEEKVEMKVDSEVQDEAGISGTNQVEDPVVDGDDVLVDGSVPQIESLQSVENKVSGVEEMGFFISGSAEEIVNRVSHEEKMNGEAKKDALEEVEVPAINQVEVPVSGNMPQYETLQIVEDRILGVEAEEDNKSVTINQVEVLASANMPQCETLQIVEDGILGVEAEEDNKDIVINQVEVPACGNMPQYETLQIVEDRILGVEAEEDTKGVTGVTTVSVVDYSVFDAIQGDSGTTRVFRVQEIEDGGERLVGRDKEVVSGRLQAETEMAAEDKEEGAEISKVEADVFVMSESLQGYFDSSSSKKDNSMIDTCKDQTIEEKQLVMSGKEEATMRFPQCHVKEQEENKKVQGREIVDMEVKAVKSEQVGLHDVDDNEAGISRSISTGNEDRVDVYMKKQVEVLVVDNKEMPIPTSLQYNMECGVVEDVETKFLEAEENMVHEIGDSQLLGSPMILVPREENAAVSVAPVSRDEEDTMVEDLVIAAEDKDYLTPVDFSSRGGGRKKRGRPPRDQASKPSSKKSEEDLCFICFDGGNLVVCDRRGCPKVYHPSCVNRDEAFFRAKGRWNCGWHICSICEKAAHYMCYTCTYSLCKGCIREAEFYCVRGNKGLCETCRSMVMLIETSDQANKPKVNFDDKSNWEYLFKDYWIDLKGKLLITLDELTKAKKPSKKPLVPNKQSSDEIYEANDGAASSSDSSSGHHKGSNSSKKRAKKRSRAINNENQVNLMDSVGSSMSGESEWASKELLEFVSHMRAGDVSALSQFEVQALLLEYIKRNNLRDPRRKSQIICDSRLQNLFGKARVGHFEMLKLIESHFLIKEISQTAVDDDQGVIGDRDGLQVDVEGSSDATMKVSEKRRKARKKEGREQSNFSDYAAVDVHNINLVYLRRNLIEELIDDVDFHQKVVGSFVRIRIYGAGQKQDMYRIVQVVGTTKAAEKYKCGKKTTDIALEILNLNKTDVIPIDSISNQEFTEEECKRLRQSIKCGFIHPMTVGDLQERALALQAIRVNDWLENEKLRLSHLRDRASEKGRRKELRECVEKLQLLNTPEERSRRLNEIPKVHADPSMDPNHESAEEEEMGDKQNDNYSRSRDSSLNKKGRELGSSGKSLAPNDSWNAGRNVPIANLQPSRSAAIDAFNYAGDRQREMMEMPANLGHAATASAWSNSQTIAGSAPSSDPTALSTSTSQSFGTGISTISSINEADKMWHYQDPSGKVQGPFSIAQLRKWNSTGYFPRDLKIWKTSEKQEDSILLTLVLTGKFQKELPVLESLNSGTSHTQKAAVVMDTGEIVARNSSRPTASGQRLAGELWKAGVATNNSHHSENSLYNLPTPTPKPGTGGWPGGQIVEHKSAAVAAQPMIPRFDSNPSQGVGTCLASPLDELQGFQQNAAPESASTMILGKQSHIEIPSKVDVRSNFGSGAYMDPICSSPTPNYEQSRSFASEREQQKSSGKSVNQYESATGTTSVSANDLASSKFAAHAGDMMRQSQFHKPETPLLIQQPGSSGDWTGSGITKGSEWSMPSPTPSTDASGLVGGAKVARAQDPTAFSNNSRFSGSAQLQTNKTSEVMPQPTADQTIGSREHQDAGKFASENMNIAGGAIQNKTNIGWSAVQGNANINWGTVAQATPSMGWVNPAQASVNVNMCWGSVAPGNPPGNVVWRAPGQGNTNMNAGWGTPMQGNPNPNPGWAASASVNANMNPNWVAASAHNFSNPNSSWVAPAQETTGHKGTWAAPMQANVNATTAWATPTQGNPNANSGYGDGNGNTNGGWNSSNSRGPQRRDNKDWQAGHADGGFQSDESRHGGGRTRMQSSSGGSSRPPQGSGERGVCRFHESGHCRKGSSCNYLHT